MLGFTEETNVCWREGAQEDGFGYVTSTDYVSVEFAVV